MYRYVMSYLKFDLCDELLGESVYCAFFIDGSLASLQIVYVQPIRGKKMRTVIPLVSATEAGSGTQYAVINATT
jgi:hypothetical protein